MLIAILVLASGLFLLVWSAGRFVEGSAATARYFGMPPLLIGMIIVGFGTSAPEMVVSALAAWQGKPGIALGNAYGSNITNIAFILGLTSLIRPIAVHSKVLRQELPLLILMSILAILLSWDALLSRLDASLLLLSFAGLVVWSIYKSLKEKKDALAEDVVQELQTQSMPLKRAVLWLVLGLVLLIIASRLLVWSATHLAQSLGVGDLVIGLTIIAVGTSLPELASSAIAARKGEHEIALGNILGSNLFNTLAVVGVAGLIKPLQFNPSIISRDMTTMLGLTLLLFFMGYGFRKQGRINRWEGLLLLGIYVGYTAILLGLG